MKTCKNVRKAKKLIGNRKKQQVSKQVTKKVGLYPNLVYTLKVCLAM